MKQKRHGFSRHPLYEIWRGMIRRCADAKRDEFKYYGGRGITVCDAWRSAEAFIHWAEAAGWEAGLTIDRINVDGNYEPDNCRWATWAEQARNRRNSTGAPRRAKRRLINGYAHRDNVGGGKRITPPIIVDGVEISVREACRRTGISSACLAQRLRRGWSLEAALHEPAKPFTNKKYLR